ncbi:MAG: dTDP-4-dehydrorhamnose 3,5-epimerase [Halioglobus sp.]
MIIEPTTLKGVLLITPKVFGDTRGFFMETWNQQVFQDNGVDIDFVQDNHSRSARGILRGMHYQTENTQGKLVRVSAGSVFDVAVDLRRSSETFGQWYGATLDAIDHKMLWVPPGFAHGFYVTSDYADFLYKCTDSYNPASEISLAFDDPTVGIDWPVELGGEPQLSEKDKNGLAWNEIPLFD